MSLKKTFMKIFKVVTGAVNEYLPIKKMKMSHGNKGSCMSDKIRTA